MPTPVTSGHFILALDIFLGRPRVELWQHGRLLPRDEALEIIMEAYERLRVQKPDGTLDPG
ncbi:MAG TPA: hypothetical protein VE645_19125 [Pseudonocardiaceae bacterium]|jgi:hypothetical protein|nr:hypothetical protein [Pseudonocardiaceae bacterium]